MGMKVQSSEWSRASSCGSSASLFLPQHGSTAGIVAAYWKEAMYHPIIRLVAGSTHPAQDRCSPSSTL